MKYLSYDEKEYRRGTLQRDVGWCETLRKAAGKSSLSFQTEDAYVV